MSTSKESFQVERIAFFSDAVFAIAITLLIIEIKVPELHDQFSEQVLINSLLHMIPRFMGFILSFFVIGIYWLAHHRLFRFVIASSQKLLWYNLFFLLPIVMMPFSTAFMSEYSYYTLSIALGVYTINICLAGYFSYRLWNIVANPANGLSEGLSAAFLKYNTSRALIVPGIFLFAFIISFVSPLATYFVFPLAPVATTLISRHFRKNHPEVMNEHYR